MEIIEHDNADALAEAFAARLGAEISTAREGLHGIMLSGGSTPLAVYRHLAATPVPASAGLRLFLSDERHVPRDDPGNNLHNAGPMMDALGLGPEQVLPVRTELDTAEAAAVDYAAQLDAFFSAGGAISLGMLGLGGDGHTASLFSPDQVAAGTGRYAIAVDRPDGRQGISLTPEVFSRIETVVFLVAGEGKRHQVATLLERPGEIPAGLVAQGCRRVELWCDRAALGHS